MHFTTIFFKRQERRQREAQKAKSKVLEIGPYTVITTNIKGLASPVKGSVLYQIKKQNLDFKGKSIIKIRECHHIMIKFNSLGRSAILNFWAFRKIDSKSIRNC